MATIEIYTTSSCGYCHAAKRLLSSKNVGFMEVNVGAEPARRAEMVQRANGGRTVPQIFIGGKHIGGYDDMAMLERHGKLDALLAG